MLTIEAANNSAENVYIQSATLNGRVYSKPWLSHEALQAGGTLRFVMGARPNKGWGRARRMRPFR